MIAPVGYRARFEECRRGGEPFATLCQISPARDLNLRPPASETNTLPLDCLACSSENFLALNMFNVKARKSGFLRCLEVVWRVYYVKKNHPKTAIGDRFRFIFVSFLSLLYFRSSQILRPTTCSGAGVKKHGHFVYPP